MKIIIASYSTRRYCYALQAVARRVLANIAIMPTADFHFILVGDQSKEVKTAFQIIQKELGSKATSELIALPILSDEHKNYKESAQLIIASLQSAAFCKARALDADYLWSVESDVLPPANALKVSMQALCFDDGYYGVAMVTYPSQGGGGFLGGRGTVHSQIEEDFKPEERKLTPDLEVRLRVKKEEESNFRKDKIHPGEEWIHENHALHEEIKKLPPKDNIWNLNGGGWRKRGWLDNAYPAIGRGAILPTDWVGLGCTLMNKEALSLAHFEGYVGKGTQDLYICWRRWYPAGIRQCVITHVLADHVVRSRSEDGDQKFDKFVLCQSYHETEGEYVGHIRCRHLPWYNFDGLDVVSEKNNGKVQAAADG